MGGVLIANRSMPRGVHGSDALPFDVAGSNTHKFPCQYRNCCEKKRVVSEKNLLSDGVCD